MQYDAMQHKPYKIPTSALRILENSDSASISHQTTYDVLVGARRQSRSNVDKAWRAEGWTGLRQLLMAEQTEDQPCGLPTARTLDMGSHGQSWPCRPTLAGQRLSRHGPPMGGHGRSWPAKSPQSAPRHDPNSWIWMNVSWKMLTLACMARPHGKTKSTGLR